MKFFGYVNGNSENLVELSEVTLLAEPKTLKEIASFILKCAEEMELDDLWEHEHFSDSHTAVDTSTDFIIHKI